MLFSKPMDKVQEFLGWIVYWPSAARQAAALRSNRSRATYLWHFGRNLVATGRRQYGDSMKWRGGCWRSGCGERRQPSFATFDSNECNTAKAPARRELLRSVSGQGDVVRDSAPETVGGPRKAYQIVQSRNGEAELTRR